MLIIGGIGSYPPAQSADALFAARKSQEELGIMNGIFRAMTSFFEESLAPKIPFRRMPIPQAWYRPNLGAMFLIPVSSTVAEGIRPPSNYLSTTLYSFMMRAYYARADILPKPSPTPAALLWPTRENLPEALQLVGGMAERARNNSETKEVKFLRCPTEIKIGLLNALADYGDLLTTVKPDEFISPILEMRNSDGNTDVSDLGKRHGILSVQKLWITDYKAGKLSMEDLHQKFFESSRSRD